MLRRKLSKTSDSLTFSITEVFKVKVKVDESVRKFAGKFNISR